MSVQTHAQGIVSDACFKYITGGMPEDLKGLVIYNGKNGSK